MGCVCRVTRCCAGRRELDPFFAFALTWRGRVDAVVPVAGFLAAEAPIFAAGAVLAPVFPEPGTGEELFCPSDFFAADCWVADSLLVGVTPRSRGLDMIRQATHPIIPFRNVKN